MGAGDVTYEFYRDSYGGDLGVEGFCAALPAAQRLVRWLTGGVTVAEDDQEAYTAYQRAVCAADEAFAEYGQGNVGGFSIGDFRTTNYQYESTTGTEQATAAAMQELAGTGLAFCGVR